jgi:hypothetical protein
VAILNLIYTLRSVGISEMIILSENLKYLIGVEPIYSCSEDKRCGHSAKDIEYKYFFKFI